MILNDYTGVAQNQWILHALLAFKITSQAFEENIGIKTALVFLLKSIKILETIFYNQKSIWKTVRLSQPFRIAHSQVLVNTNENRSPKRRISVSKTNDGKVAAIGGPVSI